MELAPERQRKIMIGTPAGESISTHYTTSMISLLMRTLGREFPANLGELNVQVYGSSILPFSRHKLVSYALDQGVTHLLFIDSDMEFPSDLILRWIQRDEPIIGANCMTRRMPFRNTAQYDVGVEVPTRHESSGLEKVFRVGTGVLWIDTSVFRIIEKPWFEFRWLPDDEAFLGEDYGFCEKLRNAGIPIHVDHDVSKQIRHMGSFGYHPMLRANLPSGYVKE